MKILLVTPACHFPSYGAVQQDIYAIIKLLKKNGHTVSLCSLDHAGQSLDLITKIKSEYKIDFTLFRPQGNIWHWLWAMVRQPIFIDRSAYAFHELVVSEFFVKYLNEQKPEVLMSFGNYSWPIFSVCNLKKINFIIRSHNYEPAHFWEELELSDKLNPSNWLRWWAKWQGERKSVKVADRLAAISPIEEKLYNTWVPGKARLLPLVSLCNLPPKTAEQEEKTRLDVFYLGASYNVSFHRRGAEMLITEIAPFVRQEAPGQFQFHICGGKLPPDLIKACNGRDLVHEGFVPDLENFLTHMDAGVFPVWSGRGMKQKIFEALTRGFPIVVPRLALGDYPLVNGKSALIAEKPEDFNELVLALKNPIMRQVLSIGARQFAENWFSEEKFIAYFSQILPYGHYK